MAAANIERYVNIRVSRSDGQGYDLAQIEQVLKAEERTQPVEGNNDQLARWKASLGAHTKYQLQTATDSKQPLRRSNTTGLYSSPCIVC